MALEARASVVLKRGEAVRTSYRTMERSVAQEARIDVSVWLKLTAVIVSVDVGQWRVWRGVLAVRLRS